MAIYKKDIDPAFLAMVAQTMKDRIAEMGITKYKFCVMNGFNYITFCNVLNAKKSYSLNMLVEYLDAMGLEIKIVKKDNGKTKENGDND